MERRLIDNKVMIIEPVYFKKSYNYIYNKEEPGGYRISFSIAEKDGNTTIITPMDSKNFRIFLLPAKRYSEKKIEKIGKVLENNRDKLFELYEKYINNEISINEISDFLEKLKGEIK
jgi:hypothetical protein